MIPDHFDRITIKTWFPGHMTKGSRQMADAVKMVDLAVELVDARAPLSSRNPALDRMLAGKPRMILANKADLASPAQNRQWEQWFAARNLRVQFLEARSKAKVRHLTEEFKRAVAEERKARGATRPLLRSVRIMIAGVPNVGKSTLINHLLDRNKAQVGPTPGVTRVTQWLPLQGEVDLLDTPGLLWPTIRDIHQGLLLALIGVFNEALIPAPLLGEFLAWKLEEQRIPVDWSRFGLAAPPESGHELLEAFANLRGFRAAGDTPDTTRAATALIKMFRDGLLGRISLEKPSDK